MIKIYHNPRCSKSRETLEILDSATKGYEIIKYLEKPFGTDQLKKIIKLLKIEPLDLIRKNEKIWKENYKDSELSDDMLIQVMMEHPQLIERPIVINGDKAIIGRPPIKILDIL